MYQQEMFSQGAFKGAKYVGGGCSGQAHSIGEGKVVKYANADCTLNYLEWCYRLQQAGRGMKGMPEIYDLVMLEPRHVYGDVYFKRYMVVMKEYVTGRGEPSRYPSFSAFRGRNFNEVPVETVLKTVGIECDHIRPLLRAFEAYMDTMFGKGPQWVNDDHSGNYMLDGDVFILLDPGTSTYLVPDGSNLELQ